MNDKNFVDVCLSPALYEHHRMENCIVVIVDIFRATSACCTVLQYGAESVLPLSDVEETRSKRENGYVIAGERDGFKLEGFDYGNSPLDFMTDEIRGKKIALTTTNGTQAINMVKKDAEEVVVGAFLNIDALIYWLITQDKNVLFLCSGWKGCVNFEDTIFAGIAASKLLENSNFESISDSVVLAKIISERAGNDILSFVASSSPIVRKRLEYLNDDFVYSLLRNKTDVVPIYRNGHLIDYRNA